VVRTLAVRLDSDGDVLLTGPAIRALATDAEVDLLVSNSGAAAARLLPGVREVLVFDAPWSGFRPPPLDPAAIDTLVRTLTARRYDLAVIFTSFHQSPLPMALLARMAGIGRVVADCEDYPGSLLDVRHQRQDVHEVRAALDLAATTGARLPAEDTGNLAVLKQFRGDQGYPEKYVVVHPGASVPSRAMSAEHGRTVVTALLAAGRQVLVTGGPGERALTAQVCAAGGTDLGGRTSLAELAEVLRQADCVVVGNTGPAHLAAAVGTPVVSLFSPVVPAHRWAPYGVPTVLLGDQHAACRASRARDCPVPGHPCLNTIDPADIVTAVATVTKTAEVQPCGS
jgi:heptosyltransferase-3